MLRLCVLLSHIRRKGKGCRGEPLHIRHPHCTLTCLLQNSRNKDCDLSSSTKKREPAANILGHYLRPRATEKQEGKKKKKKWGDGVLSAKKLLLDRTGLCILREG